MDRSLEGTEPEGTGDGFADRVAVEIPGLYRYAVMLAGETAAAEDLVSETVLRALEHEEQYQGEASVRTWLHRILSHLAIDRLRHRSFEVSVASVEEAWRDETYSVDPAVVVERAESAAAVREALVHLPLGYRTVVVLHDAAGWRAREIAELLGLSLSATKQRLRRGRMMLVSVLGEGKERRMANHGVPLGCWEARERVSAYLDDELDASDRLELEDHLRRCVTCPPLYQALVTATAALGRFRDPDSVIPPEVAERIRARTGLP